MIDFVKLESAGYLRRRFLVSLQSYQLRIVIVLLSAEGRDWQRLTPSCMMFLLRRLKMVMDVDVQSLLSLVLLVRPNSHLEVSWLDRIELLPGKF